MKLIVALLCGLMIAGCSRAAEAPSGAAWAHGLGMADLEVEIAHRIAMTVEQHKLSPAQAEVLTTRLRSLQGEEREWRETRTFTTERYNSVERDLLAIAGAIPDLPPKYPPRSPPTATFAEPRENRLDLTGFRLTFEDDFHDLSIGARGGATRWFAPIHTDFGEAHFLPHGPGGPFSRVRLGLLGDALRIEARKTAKGWTGGLIQSADDKGRGFSQRYGYFEMRAKLPKGKGTWPAFWLLTQPALNDDTIVRGEIDVFEQYGDEPDRLHMSVHLWPAQGWNAGGLLKHWYRSKKLTLFGLSDEFHRFGVLVTPTVVRFFYDDRALADFPSLPEYRQPLYLLVNLTMHEKGVAEAKEPAELLVDYVRAYQLPPAMLAEPPS